MEHTMIVQREPEPLALARIGERFRHLRIVDPAAERAITTSMHRFGQLTPVVVCRLEPVLALKNDEQKKEVFLRIC